MTKHSGYAPGVTLQVQGVGLRNVGSERRKILWEFK